MEICCPICGAPLCAAQRCLKCAAGHSFDIAHQGYVNLLLPDQRHSRHPGDTKEMVAARRRFLRSGIYRPIALQMQALLQSLPQGAVVLDAGCGEGYYLSELLQARPDLCCYGIDISKDAVRYAAGAEKHAKWVAGSAAHLPFADGSFDAVLCMFAMVVPDEFARVLKPDGIFLNVTAGRSHLTGLKQIIYPEILEKSEMNHAFLGFSAPEQTHLAFDFSVEGREMVQDLLWMTPHVWRISKEGAARAAETTRLDDRAEVDFWRYRRSRFTPN